MTWLAIFWFLFTAIFLALGCFHWKMAGKSISHFKVSERPMDKMSGVQAKIQIKGSDIDEPLNEFTRDFNSYLDDYNKSSNRQHKFQAGGYWVASATAIFSFVLTIL